MKCESPGLYHKFTPKCFGLRVAILLVGYKLNDVIKSIAIQKIATMTINIAVLTTSMAGSG